MINNETKLNFLLVDDHPIYREGIRDVINSMGIVQSCDEAENGLIATQMAKSKSYDLIFLDIEMPIMAGAECAKELNQISPKSKVVVISMINSIFRIIEMLEFGVKGFVLKNTNADELKEAINKIQNGELYLTPEVKELWFNYMFNKSVIQKNNKKLVKLSNRQKEIVYHICLQETASEIADKLHLSERTVNNHRAQIMKLMQVKTSIGIVLYAVKNGIFTVEVNNS